MKILYGIKTGFIICTSILHKMYQRKSISCVIFKIRFFIKSLEMDLLYKLHHRFFAFLQNCYEES